MQKVLIVHDSAIARENLRHQLRPAGFECIEARDALSGLQRAVEDRPAAVIVARTLAGLDGDEMRRVLASDSQTEHLPVLLA
ncbi:MAG: hypothetical protein AB8G23_15335 [Myxococcota bacterium]